MKKEKKLRVSLFIVPIIVISTVVSMLYVTFNAVIQNYISSLAMQHITARFEVLDSYYTNSGYEGYYNNKSEFLMKVYHIIIDANGNIVYPVVTSESEDEQERINMIGNSYTNGTLSLSKDKKGKIKFSLNTYYISEKTYVGTYDGFFVSASTENSEQKKYSVGYVKNSV